LSSRGNVIDAAHADGGPVEEDAGTPECSTGSGDWEGTCEPIGDAGVADVCDYGYWSGSGSADPQGNSIKCDETDVCCFVSTACEDEGYSCHADSTTGTCSGSPGWKQRGCPTETPWCCQGTYADTKMAGYYPF